MDVRSAISRAKAYIQDVYSGETLANLGLEETEYDELHDTWSITVGFSRPWQAATALPVMETLAYQPSGRTYKVVTVNRAGEVVSMKNRATVASE